MPLCLQHLTQQTQRHLYWMKTACVAINITMKYTGVGTVEAPIS